MNSQQIIEALSSYSAEEIERLLDKLLNELIARHDFQECFELALQLQQYGFIQHAIFVCDTVNATVEMDEFLLLKSEILLDDNAIDEALDILLSVSPSSPLYVQALLIMADAYVLIDLDEVALYKLQQAKTIAPDEAIIDLALYELHFKMGNFAEAKTALRGVQQANSIDTVDYSKKMSRLLVHTGEYEEAIALLETLTNEQHDSNSLFELGLIYYRLEEYERAFKRLEQLVTQDADYLSAYYYMGQCAIQTGQLQKGIELLEYALLQNPYHEALYMTLFEHYERLQHHTKLHELMKQANEHLVDSDQLVVLYARYLMKQEDFEAVIDFAVPYSDDLEDSELSWILAVSYGQLEEDDHAKKWFEKAYEHFNEDVQFLEDYYFYAKQIGQKETLYRIRQQMQQLGHTNALDMEEWYD